MKFNDWLSAHALSLALILSGIAYLLLMIGPRDVGKFLLTLAAFLLGVGIERLRNQKRKGGKE